MPSKAAHPNPLSLETEPPPRVPRYGKLILGRVTAPFRLGKIRIWFLFPVPLGLTLIVWALFVIVIGPPPECGGCSVGGVAAETVEREKNGPWYC